MNRIRQFTVIVTDAWNRIDDGIYSVLEEAEGEVRIRFLVCGKARNVRVEEDMLIQRLEEMQLKEIDGKCYRKEDVCDGAHWRICVRYDAVTIMAKGYASGFPEEFRRLMGYLHEELGLPKAPMDPGDYRELTQREKKGLKWRLLDEEERTQTYHWNGEDLFA